MTKPGAGWYVYTLVDPRTSVPFYIGKGKGRRAWQHEAAIRNGRPDGNLAKSNRISEIIEAGLSVQVEIVSHFADEHAAIAAERDLIASTEGIVNIQSGGVAQSKMARLQVYRNQMLTAISRARPIDRWMLLYPERDPQMYRDIEASHLELLRHIEVEIEKEASRV